MCFPPNYTEPPIAIEKDGEDREGGSDDEVE